MKRKLFFLILIFLVLIIPASAQKGTVKLLAVAETDDGYKGSIANLFLEIEPGSGRVFIDTFPASKLDTQISTRFAKNIACKYLNVDCDNFDFYYTIKADTAIIGGPSAGAATTILTISLLNDIPLDNSVVITGTINSGNLIGSVSGIKEKVEAAAGDGLSKVLIPLGEGSIDIENDTIDIIKLGKNLSIEVIEVGDIDSALYEFTGINSTRQQKDLEINPEYKDTMRLLADDLCSRSKELKQRVIEHTSENTSDIDELYAATEERANNLSKKGQIYYDQEKFYSAASFCYGANVNFNVLLLKLDDLSNNEIRIKALELKADVQRMDDNISDMDIDTITDLQAYMIVKERLYDSEEATGRILDLVENNTESAISALAYASERLNSARSWSEFFGNDGKKFEIGERELRDSCIDKLSEAKEHYQYVQLSLPGYLGDTNDLIKSAEADYSEKDYALCLFKASLSKAQVNIVISSIGVMEDDMGDLVDRKLDAAKRSIIQQQENDIFPIGGYSYYEYSKSLKDEDIYSSLLYSEYALELSNLDIYFKPKKVLLDDDSQRLSFLIFITGLIAGILITLTIIKIKKTMMYLIKPSRKQGSKKSNKKK